MSPDPRKILDVQPGASREEILSAYRREAKRAHPDQGGTAAQFRQVQAAYRALLDEEIPAQRHPYPQPESTDHLLEVKVTSAMAKVGAIVRVPLPKWADCHTCDGVGVAPKRRRPCSQCDGTGHVAELVHTHEFVLPCQRCGGTGFTGRQCSECIEGRTLVALERKVRLPAGTRTGQVFRVAGRPAFVVKVVHPQP